MTNYTNRLENEQIENNPKACEYIHDIDQRLAETAFYNTSFSPEKRGLSVRMEYSESLLVDKSEVLEAIATASKRNAELKPDYDILVDEWFKSHRERLIERYNTWLHSHSRVASSFIVGPANFPLARNQNRSNSADANYSAIGEFRTKSIKNILKFVLPYGDGTVIKTDDPNVCNKIEQKITALELQREQMKEINKVVRKYFKKGCPDISTEKLAEFKGVMQERFNIDEQVTLSFIKPNYSGKVSGFLSWELQNLGANITRYKKRLKEAEQTKSVSIDQEFSNGIRVCVSDDQKICIFFGFKPSDEIRTLLKANAFKFSRNRDNAWVRKLTLNAEASYTSYIKPNIEHLELM